MHHLYNSAFTIVSRGTKVVSQFDNLRPLLRVGGDFEKPSYTTLNTASPEYSSGETQDDRCFYALYVMLC